MKTKIPCEMIRDLLPLSAEHLTSPETEAEIQAHLAECPACREIYEEMTAPEPARSEQVPAEVDGLRKVKKRRKLVLAAAALAVVLVAAGLYAWFRIRQSKPSVSYDAESRTIVLCGSSGYDKVQLPAEAGEAVNLEVQDDSFHMSFYLPVLRTDGEDLQSCIPAYVERTDKSLQFLRDYLRANAPKQDITAQAAKSVEFTVRNSDYDYSYNNSDDERIVIEMGRYYWHREELYLLSLMNTKNVGWQQLGYAWYLGCCVDPYFDREGSVIPDSEAYSPVYEAYLRGGGSPEAISTPDQRILADAVSWVCLTKGMYWGSAYESYPICETAFYRGPGKSKDNQNKMSVLMATSLIAWLTEQYGFEKVSDFCFGACSFDEAFGTSFESAYQSWKDCILSKYG